MEQAQQLEQIKTKLNKNIPREVISKRQGGAGKALSYLEGWYVIDQLNDIFGPEGWSYDTTELRCTHSGIIKNSKSEDIFSSSYVATVALYAQFPGSDSAKRVTDVGFGNGTDKSDPGKPHELATKEAVTDALKRCAKSLGKSLGLALYDKSGEFIDETQPQAAVSAPVAKEAGGNQSPPAPSSRDSVNRQITAMSKVVIAKRMSTADALKADLKAKYGVDSKEALSDEQAKELLTTLEKQANG